MQITIWKPEANDWSEISEQSHTEVAELLIRGARMRSGDECFDLTPPSEAEDNLALDMAISAWGSDSE